MSPAGLPTWLEVASRGTMDCQPKQRSKLHRNRVDAPAAARDNEVLRLPGPSSQAAGHESSPLLPRFKGTVERLRKLPEQ